MTLTFDTGKAVRRLRGPLQNQEAAEAGVDVIAEAQEELVTTSQFRLELALLEKRILALVLLQTGIIIGAVAAIEVLVSN